MGSGGMMIDPYHGLACVRLARLLFD
jgi:hypothetical protein